MKIKCSYCRAYIDDTDVTCPYCGAFNENLKRNANGSPQTIEELQEWYKSHNLPDSKVTRFFIGENYTGSRAFGIYKEEGSGNFVVYKNKADGSRAIRYEGKDEAYAVNELYIKLKEEIVNQKQHNLNKSKKRKKSISLSTAMSLGIVLFTFLFLTIAIIISCNQPLRGYYLYDDDYYYYQNGDWFLYTTYSGWHKSVAPSGLTDNYSDYYESSSYLSDYGVDDFSYTDYYDPPSSSSSDDWDSSSSWDSGSSWDSSSTDWSSDW